MENKRSAYLRSPEGFRNYVLTTFDILKNQFINKNNQYGDLDPLANFKKGALLNAGTDNPEEMYETLKGYLNKHVVHVYGHRVNGGKTDESWRDIAIYSILALLIQEIYYEERMQEIEDDVDYEQQLKGN